LRAIRFGILGQNASKERIRLLSLAIKDSKEEVKKELIVIRLV